MTKRIDLILEDVNRLGKVEVINLAKEYGVSVETIRRDLTALEKKGLLYRVHGGAINKKVKDAGNSFQTRQRYNLDKKKIIAQNAMEYLFEDMVIGLDASSSSWHFSQLMPDIPCTVVTNSMHNMTALVNKPNVKTIATGGVYSSKYNAFYGPLSEHLLSRLHIDISFISCVGFDSEGKIWESNELNASVKQKLMNVSKQFFLLADDSKYQKTNLIQLSDFSQIDMLFTTEGVDNHLYECCKTHNVSLIK
ncbi:MULTISPECIES: DeoR/GlpR family DNA-binding transcription regulator [Pasteurellaceae]|uniref:DeoR/GlpR family DNA-binding transcription regulator n=1 Tax=Pasteurella atlantica TaxID=2827233 RepID=A0AAW8CRQ0_9PAST|nr:DeoR/GlpR family DNA-binding transcription regulator [Pasteurella atlantica]MBR0574391.1 DeoR/GlpR transcriptional regulator [Pasteurella atlantica]MDP8040295.1 DeoR/GlpR family DNA-binding transcription regulator [Pasteurella atlantica]MDP8042449.1 DeoR/GlpR family DNA-binding transcription regulator [Pasteurella atlantica]MDP8044298.1 DeoR/GlpR family DNA-binding transcription regulator [Pasteurella atlantica]MDP8046613.1 DeoR/GlpR family DNA-binding transcription regulator [Pasteurella a